MHKKLSQNENAIMAFMKQSYGTSSECKAHVFSEIVLSCSETDRPGRTRQEEADRKIQLLMLADIRAKRKIQDWAANVLDEFVRRIIHGGDTGVVYPAVMFVIYRYVYNGGSQEDFVFNFNMRPPCLC
jgi:hypothetical protein